MTDQPKSDRTIPSLDGLRAVSIAIVVFAHSQGTRGFPAWIPDAVLNHGKLGVHIFFIISGFLITTLLIKEQNRTRTISLGLFYARRTLRIFPPLYAFLGVTAVATALGWLHIPWRNFLFTTTFTVNYIPLKVWVTNHLWSLSVEEQFYLVWPLTLKLAGKHRAFWIAGILSISAPLFCLAVYLINPSLGSWLAMCFPFVADSIAAGCVLAGVLPWLRRQSFFHLFGAAAGDLVIPFIFLLDLGRDHPRIHLGLTQIALDFCICYALVRYTEFPDGFFARLLNTRVFAFFGKISYSLYLWQQVFISPTDPEQAFPLNIVESFGCALASYYLIELPSGRIRKRLRPALALRPGEKRG